jgi:hypothetical protein
MFSTWQEARDAEAKETSSVVNLLIKIDRNPTDKLRPRWIARLRELTTDEEFEYFTLAHNL